MDKEMQDKLWTSLPKEARIWIRKEYRHILNKLWQRSAYLRGRLRMMRDIYGEHNLTSHTEPEEVLTILRKDIIEEFNQAAADLSRTGNLEYKGKRELLKNLFGDKCLPDKLIPSDSTELKSKPKFQVGDIVSNVYCKRERLTIAEICPILKNGNQQYRVKEYPYLWNECELEPYTEEKETIVSNDETMNDTKETIEEKSYPPYLDRPKTIVPVKEEKELKSKALYDALCELESASIKVRKALISM